MSQIQNITMPKWGMSMEDGDLTGWLIEVGDEVSVGQKVAEVETDKISGEVECPVAGIVRKFVAEVGETLPVGALLAVVASADVDDAALDAHIKEFQDSFEPGE